MDPPDPRVFFFISHLNSSSVRRSKLHKCVPKITIGLIFGSFHIELKRGTLILDSGGPASISRMKNPHHSDVSSSGAATGPANPASRGSTQGGRHFEDLFKELSN